jgi:hypothetical protein
LESKVLNSSIEPRLALHSLAAHCNVPACNSNRHKRMCRTQETESIALDVACLACWFYYTGWYFLHLSFSRGAVKQHGMQRPGFG